MSPSVIETSRQNRLAVVVNTRAGHIKRHPGEAHRVTEAVGLGTEIITAATLEELDNGLERAKAHNTNIIAIVGGDGTIGVTVTAIVRTWNKLPLPVIALLRGGTMNTIANSINIPRGRPEHLARALRTQTLHGPLRTTTRGTIVIADRLGFLFGTGIVQAFLREYYSTGEPSPVTAARVLSRGVISAVTHGPLITRLAAPVSALVRFSDGTVWTHRPWLTLAAGTVPQIGLGFTPFYRANERTDSFHLLGIHSSPLSFALELPRVWRALSLSKDKALDSLTPDATLVTDAPSLPYMLDGDLFDGPPTLRLTAGPTLSLWSP